MYSGQLTAKGFRQHEELGQSLGRAYDNILITYVPYTPTITTWINLYCILSSNRWFEQIVMMANLMCDIY